MIIKWYIDRSVNMWAANPKYLTTGRPKNVVFLLVLQDATPSSLNIGFWNDLCI